MEMKNAFIAGLLLIIFIGAPISIEAVAANPLSYEVGVTSDFSLVSGNGALLPYDADSGLSTVTYEEMLLAKLTEEMLAGTSVPDGLYINELMADNDITIAGPNMDYPDWIELYNASSESLDISGIYLTDDINNPTKWKFPKDTTIGPGEYLLVWADGKPSKDELHANFSLNANGETVALFASDGTTMIDQVTFNKQIRDTSFGRLPDGSADWEYLSTPTPGETNGEKAPEVQAPSWLQPILILAAAIVIALLVFNRRSILRRD